MGSKLESNGQEGGEEEALEQVALNSTIPAVLLLPRI